MLCRMAQLSWRFVVGCDHVRHGRSDAEPTGPQGGRDQAIDRGRGAQPDRRARFQRGRPSSRSPNAADVGQRTFFRYFPTKESVVYADVEQKWDRAVAVLDDRPIDEPPFLSLRAALDELARLAAAEDVDSIRLRMRLADEHPAIADYHRELFAVRLGGRFASFVAERLGVDPTTDPRPGMWTALAMSSFRIGFEQWVANDLVGDLHRFIDDALTAADDAIRTTHAADGLITDAPDSVTSERVADPTARPTPTAASTTTTGSAGARMRWEP